MSNLKLALGLELLTFPLKGSRTNKEVWCSDFAFLLFTDRTRNKKCGIFVYRMAIKF